MNNTKMQKIYDFEGKLKGYRLGEWYLYKNYCWMNNYDWIISKEYHLHIGSFEISKLYDEGRIEFAHSCKEGKLRLAELNREKQ